MYVCISCIRTYVHVRINFVPVCFLYQWSSSDPRTGAKVSPFSCVYEFVYVHVGETCVLIVMWCKCVPYLISYSMSVPRCILAVSNGLLALKVENVNDIWTAPVALFDSLQASSSPWLRPFRLPTGVGGAEEIYDFVFEQSNTAGLTSGRRLPTQQDTQVQCVPLVHVLVSVHL